MKFYKIFIICIILTCFPFTVVAQDNQTYLSFDLITRSVVYLVGESPRMELIDGVQYEIGKRVPGSKEFKLDMNKIAGTGFFVKKGDRLFLVTAGHVAKGLMMTNLTEVKLISSDASWLSKLYSIDKKVKWTFSEKADIAVSQLNDPLFISNFIHNAIDIKFLTDTETFPVPEIPLVIVGFPLGLGIQKNFSPLRRETNAASGLIDYPRGDTKQLATFFVLQDPSIGGFSGAPVFTLQANTFGSSVVIGVNATLCIGVIHATVSDNTGGKLGLVTPAKYAYELIK